MASRKNLQQIANSLIGENAKLPINIDKIIKNEGIKLIPYDEDGVSGILIIEPNNTIIGFSSKESKNRQRFTKAHELGHFMLHRGGSLFIDKDFKTMYRPSSNVPSTEMNEWEANEFAACILMPEHLVREEMRKILIDYTDEDSNNSWIEQLAKKFEVSISAMSIRISRLGLQ